MSKKDSDDEPVTVDYYKKHTGWRAHRKAVPMKYLEKGKPSLFRRVLPYALIAVVAFVVLHHVLHIR